MNETDVTKDGLANVRPGRDALTGVHTGVGPADRTLARRDRRRGEQEMVPPAEPTSYYGNPVINAPVWHSPDIPGYLFLGGLAGAGSVIAAAGQLTGRPHLSRALKVGSTVGIGLSLVALVHDLGRRDRFLNMLRTFKPTSPMSVGSWLLSAYGPAAILAAASDLSGLAPGLGTAATLGAAALGPGVATYTAALIANTAVPAWHGGYREMPFVFASSAVTSAAGLGLLTAPVAETGPVRALAAAGGLAELATELVLEKRLGMVAEVFTAGRAHRFHRIAQGLLAAGVVGTLLGGRRRLLAGASGASLLAGSALTRFSIFEAGMASAVDPKYTVVPQRERLQRRAGEPAAARPEPPA